MNWTKEEMEKYKERKGKLPTIVKIKKRELPFVQIDKRPVEDTRLSWKAKGLLLYLLSKPNDWQVYLADLVKRSKDRRSATTTGLLELEKNGYLYKERRRNDKGQFIGWLYWIYEIPEKNRKDKKT